MNILLFILGFWFFCLLFCKWRTRPTKYIPAPSFEDLEYALINEEDDDKVIKLFSHYTYTDIIKIRKVHVLVSKRNNPSILAKLQEADTSPIL